MGVWIGRRALYPLRGDIVGGSEFISDVGGVYRGTEYRSQKTVDSRQEKRNSETARQLGS